MSRPAAVEAQNRRAAQNQRPPFVVEDPPESPERQREMFHLPEGFEIELVASEPEVVNPINLNFDAAGNLYVSQSIEYPIPAPPDRKGRDRILRITDTDEDGVPDQTSTFASGLNIPIGITPVPGGALGFSIPKVYQFADPNGDGMVDQQEVRFEEFGFDDTHGMVSSLTWWVDGWVYGCHGFVNTSEIAGTDGDTISMTSGNTYRLKPDGSRIEHWAHGQVNPFGLAIDPRGNVFTSDCHTRPATMVLRGAHYPRSPGDGLGLGPELMQHSHGSTGIAGIVYYAADQFPESYYGSLLIGNPITGRVNHDLLEEHGSTFRAIEQDDFLSCDDPWFRPVDLQLGPDGALYIADMYNCIIGHYEVPLHHPKRDREHGRIWRVTYVGDDAGDSRPTNLTKASVDELVERLADPNLVIRTHATHQLVERYGDHAADAVRDALSGNSTAEQRAHGLWVLQRLGVLTPNDWKPLVSDESPLVRLHTVKALAESGELSGESREAVLSRLDDEDAFVQRTAVESLGQHPHGSSVNPLLHLIAHTDSSDACLIHSARMALRDTLEEIDRLQEIEREHAGSPQDLATLADVVMGIPSPSSADFLWRRFQQEEFRPATQSEILRHIVRNIAEDKLPQILTLAESFADRDRDTQIAVAAAVHQASQERGIPVPDRINEWGETLVQSLLTSDDKAHVGRGIQLVEQMKLASLGNELAKLCEIDTPYPDHRYNAVQALEAVSPPEVVTTFVEILNDENDVPALRQYVAEKLATRKDPAIREKVVQLLPSAPQLVVVGLARGLVLDSEGASALLEFIENGKVSRQVLQDRKVQRMMPYSGVEDGVSRMKVLLADLPTIDQKIQQTIDQRRLAFRNTNPNAAHGAEIFKKNCAVCHRLENQGEKIGPELDGVGVRGVDRLLEDILDPNRTVDKNYRATVVATHGGRVLTGLAVGEEGEVLILADQNGKKQRIPLSDIEERKLIESSAMPANVDELLKPNDFHDLLAFLLTKTVKPADSGAR